MNFMSEIYVFIRSLNHSDSVLSSHEVTLAGASHTLLDFASTTRLESVLALVHDSLFNLINCSQLLFLET